MNVFPRNGASIELGVDTRIRFYHSVPKYSERLYLII